MLIISYDAVGDDEFDRLTEYPAFSAFARQAAVCRAIPTLDVSNTYPVHASIATGATPGAHGLTSNTEHFPKRHPVWNSRESRIRAKTLWQAVAEKGIDCAAVFWPSTAYSKAIRHNIPEVLAKPGENQVVTSLKAGGKALQLEMLLRHRKLLSGISQPNLDSFAAACMGDILRKRRPGLALLHLTAYDSICHEHGKGSAELRAALESLDRNLSLLLDAAGDDDVIILTDHSQINVHTTLTPNDGLVAEGLLRKNNDEYIPGASGCFFECCGGTAFFRAGSLEPARTERIREAIGRSEGFGRYLTAGEMRMAGYSGAAFGFGAEPGYCYSAFDEGHKAQHGYPADTARSADYGVFYAARGFGLHPCVKTGEGSLLDIAPLVAGRLGLDMPQLRNNAGGL